MKAVTTTIRSEKCYGCTRSHLLPDLLICLLISSCVCSVRALAQTRADLDGVDHNNSQGPSDPGPGTHIDTKRPADPQLLAVLDKMDAAGALSPGKRQGVPESLSRLREFCGAFGASVSCHG